MAVPDYQTLMLPLLQSLADGQARTAAEIRADLANSLGLDSEDLQATLSSGQPVFHNRVGWASTYLVRGGLLRRPKRGVYEMTERGQEVLASEPDRIDNRLLEQYEEFQEFLAPAEQVRGGRPRQVRGGRPRQVLRPVGWKRPVRKNDSVRQWKKQTSPWPPSWWIGYAAASPLSLKSSC